MSFGIEGVGGTFEDAGLEGPGNGGGRVVIIVTAVVFDDGVIGGGRRGASKVSGREMDPILKAEGKAVFVKGIVVKGGIIGKGARGEIDRVIGAGVFVARILFGIGNNSITKMNGAEGDKMSWKTLSVMNEGLFDDLSENGSGKRRGINRSVDVMSDLSKGDESSVVKFIERGRGSVRFLRREREGMGTVSEGRFVRVGNGLRRGFERSFERRIERSHGGIAKRRREDRQQ